MDFVDTRRTPQHIGCICNIVVIVELCVIVDIIVIVNRRDIVDITDIVGSGGVIGSGSSCSNACASVGSRVSQEGATINKHREYEFCSHFLRECGSRSNNKNKSKNMAVWMLLMGDVSMCGRFRQDYCRRS